MAKMKKSASAPRGDRKSPRNTEKPSKFRPVKHKLDSDSKHCGSRRSSRLSGSTQHDSLYDFRADSLPHNTTKPRSAKHSSASQKAQLKMKNPKTDLKTRKTAKTNTVKPTVKQGAVQNKGKKTLWNFKKKLEVSQVDMEEQRFITPKVRLRKVLCAGNQNSENVVKKKAKKLKPIAQPNLDDVSPILRKDSITPGRKRTRKQRSTGLTRNDVHQSKNIGQFSDSILESPPVSFLGQPPSEIEDTDNDSAVFVSPRKVMHRLKKGQTSTPANVLIKKTSKKCAKKSKRSVKSPIKVKDTSTPIEGKTKLRNESVFTQIKSGVMDVSSVHVVETPTSDYGSMESSMTMGPVSFERKTKDRGSPTPAFSLEDIDVPSLNKSMTKMYKRSKKQYRSSKTMASKVEEWADKINSEMEDIENFELSVEG